MHGLGGRGVTFLHEHFLGQQGACLNEIKCLLLTGSILTRLQLRGLIRNKRLAFSFIGNIFFYSPLIIKG